VNVFSIEALLGVDPLDAGCGATCAVLERYVEAPDTFPGVAAHLALCRACRADYEGLLAAANPRTPAAARPRP
jgi:hypothetical protein